jgi:hypothetical protein
MKKVLKKMGVIFTLMMFFTVMGGAFNKEIKLTNNLSFGTKTVYASNGLKDSLNNIQGSGGVIGSEAKTKISGLAKDGLDITMIIVMGIVMISGIWTTIKFTRAGEDPKSKAILKGVLVMHILGLVFLANYFGLMTFSFDKIKIFN